jgi:hypothetical protein
MRCRGFKVTGEALRYFRRGTNANNDTAPAMNLFRKLRLVWENSHMDFSGLCFISPRKRLVIKYSMEFPAGKMFVFIGISQFILAPIDLAAYLH